MCSVWIVYFFKTLHFLGCVYSLILFIIVVWSPLTQTATGQGMNKEIRANFRKFNCCIFSVYGMIKFAWVSCSENPGISHMAFAQDSRVLSASGHVLNSDKNRQELWIAWEQFFLQKVLGLIHSQDSQILFYLRVKILCLASVLKFTWKLSDYFYGH